MFFAFNWTSWKKWVFIGLLIGIVYFSYQLSSVYVFEPQSQVQYAGGISKAVKDEKEVALTVNVSWGDDVIIDILDVLREEKVKATFFINGEWALRNEEVAKLIIEENHEVGLLGFYDEPYRNLPQEKITEDIKNGESTLKRLDYEPLTLVRPPENQYNKDVVKHINSLGYRTVFWSVYAHIQQSTNANQKAKSISGELSKGDIVLFSAQDHLTATPKVIKNIIKAKKGEDFKFVTVTELLSPAKIKLNPIN